MHTAWTQAAAFEVIAKERKGLAHATGPTQKRKGLLS
jgi:hypothetical protein